MNVALRFALVGVMTSVASVSGANLLMNGGFDDPPWLNSGQTDVAVDGQKMIIQDPLEPGYADAIGGILDWVYATPNSGRSSDHGIKRPTEFGDPTGPRMLFINNWERRVSQPVGVSITAGRRYVAEITFGMLLDYQLSPKAGRLQFWAGEPSFANPDQMAAGSILLGEIRIGSQGWTGQLDRVVGDRSLTRLQVAYDAMPGDAALGKPLTISMFTEFGSEGITCWDDASIEVVPEPASLAVLGMGLLLLRRRR